MTKNANRSRPSRPKMIPRGANLLLLVGFSVKTSFGIAVRCDTVHIPSNTCTFQDLNSPKPVGQYSQDYSGLTCKSSCNPVNPVQLIWVTSFCAHLLLGL